ncbi:MAG: hypothetical protein ACKVQW_13210 [Pyrinomonadaceae bacterium]
MKNKLTRLTFLAIIAFAVSLSSTAMAQTRAYYVSDREVQNLLDRIESETNRFKSTIDRSLDRSVADGTDREDSINQRVSSFETATDRLRDNFRERRSTASDVQTVLDRGADVNRIVVNSRFPNVVENQWRTIRTHLDTLATYYRLRTNWNTGVYNPGGDYTVSDAQMRALLNRLRNRSSSFRRSFERWAYRSNQTGIVQDVSDFDRAVDELRRNFRNRSTSAYTVLSEASPINSFLSSNQTNYTLTSQWNLIRNDLNTLSGYYSMNWDWNNPTWPGGNTNAGFDAMLTGTYRLNTSRSDNLNSVIDRAVNDSRYNATQRERIRRQLERRLASPNTFVVEKRGRDVTLASTNAPSVNLTADGVARSETSPNGRTVTTIVTSTSRDLTINYEGDRINDYYVAFAPMNNGLQVTRRVYLENQNETVTVTSFYDKTSSVADWKAVGYPNNNNTGSVNSGFIIPNNTALIAKLDTPLSTKTARDGDRFTMTVTSPSQYSGAVIEGSVVGERSGVFSGRANLSLSFDTIRLQNGQTYRFAGIVDSVTEADGDTVSVNNEGVIRDGSQTTKTVTRAGIGAALGAIIGAIAGGGKGAAIGAGIGAGAGAGTVVLQGRDNLELETGSQFNLTATGPASTVGVK